MFQQNVIHDSEHEATHLPYFTHTQRERERDRETESR